MSRHNVRRTFDIDGLTVGDGSPMYTIAEIGLSPGKDLDRALALVDAAADGGANCAKFQVFSPREIVSAHGEAAAHFPYGDIVKAFETMEVPRDFFQEIVARCADRSITFLASVFDEPALTFLDQFSPTAYKIAAFELGDRFLLEAVAERGKPMILSTGMANLADVERAITVITKSGGPDFALLHTVSAYPAEPRDYNLRAMATMRSAFGAPVGLSDHTPGLEAPIAAAALGAELIEKHITLSRNDPGPDDSFALEPAMLRDMVNAIRTTEEMLGDGVKRATPSESDLKARMQLALVASRDLQAGEALDHSVLSIKRAGSGLAPSMLDVVLGSTLREPASADEPIQWRHLVDRSAAADP